MRMRTKFGTAAALSAVLTATAATAQDSRVEVSPFVGYTFSEGFTIDPVVFDGDRFNKINPTSAFSWGVAFDVNVNENMAVGFLYDDQRSRLQASGTSDVEFADLNVRNYHGTFTYTFFEDDESGLRPFLLGGLGGDPVQPRRHHGGGHRWRHQVLVHLGRRLQGLPEPELRRPGHGTLDSDARGRGPRGNLVQPLLALGLLSARGYRLLQPVRALFRSDIQVLESPAGLRPSVSLSVEGTNDHAGGVSRRRRGFRARHRNAARLHGEPSRADAPGARSVAISTLTVPRWNLGPAVSRWPARSAAALA